MVFDDEYLPSPLQTLSNIPKQFMLFSAILKRNLMYYSFNNSELVSAIMINNETILTKGQFVLKITVDSYFKRYYFSFSLKIIEAKELKIK